MYKYRSLGLEPVLHRDTRLESPDKTFSLLVHRSFILIAIKIIQPCTYTPTLLCVDGFSRRGEALYCATIGGKPLPCQIIHSPEINCRWKQTETSHNSKLTLLVSLASWHRLFFSSLRFRANGGNSKHVRSFTHLS